MGQEDRRMWLSAHQRKRIPETHIVKTLILGFGPPELGENYFLMFNSVLILVAILVLSQVI